VHVKLSYSVQSTDIEITQPEVVRKYAHHGPALGARQPKAIIPKRRAIQ
jgi:hypothetical protein